MRLVMFLTLFALACSSHPTLPDSGATGDGGDVDAGIDAGQTCDGGQGLNDVGECLVPTSTPGSGCQNPILVKFPDVAGVLSVSGDSTGFPNTVDCTLAHSGTRLSPEGEVAFQVELDGGGTLRAWVDGPASMSVSSSPTCPWLACVSLTQTEPFFHATQSIREYTSDPFVWVSGPGPFTVHFRRSPPQANQLTGATGLDLDDAGVASTTGNLSDFFDGVNDTGDLGLIAVFRVPLRSDSSVELSGQLPDGGFIEALSGSASSAPGASVSAIASAGDFYFAVKAPSRGRDLVVPFSVQVQATPLPPAPDSCASPTALVFVGDGGAQVATSSGTTFGRFSDQGPSCVPGLEGGPVQIFAFTTTTTSNLDALLSTADLGFRPALSLRGTSCRATDGACNVAAVPGAAARVTASLLPAGSYWLLAGSQGPGNQPDGGPFELRVTLTP